MKKLLVISLCLVGISSFAMAKAYQTYTCDNTVPGGSTYMLVLVDATSSTPAQNFILQKNVSARTNWSFISTDASLHRASETGAFTVTYQDDTKVNWSKHQNTCFVNLNDTYVFTVANQGASPAAQVTVVQAMAQNPNMDCPAVNPPVPRTTNLSCQRID